MENNGTEKNGLVTPNPEQYALRFHPSWCSSKMRLIRFYVFEEEPPSSSQCLLIWDISGHGSIDCINESLSVYHKTSYENVEKEITMLKWVVNYIVSQALQTILKLVGDFKNVYWHVLHKSFANAESCTWAKTSAHLHQISTKTWCCRFQTFSAMLSPLVFIFWLRWYIHTV